MTKRAIYIFLFITCLCSCTDRDFVDYTTDPATNLEALWQTIDTKYCFVEEKGVDWDHIHQLYLQKIHSADYQQPTDEQLFDLMAAMLDSLKDGHVNLYSWFDVSSNSDWYSGYNRNFDSDILYTYYLMDSRRAGGLTYTILLPDSVGYIYYSSFSNSPANIAALLAQKMRECKGIILDVRNNTGGDLENAYTLAAPFLKEDQTVGYWQHKTGPGHFDYSPITEMKAKKHDKVTWLKPTIVLANRYSYSATNFFINIMKSPDNKHIAVIGDKSGGGGGMPMSYELPNGWSVRMSSIKMYDRDKHSIEEGIEPHAKVTLTSANQDDIIERARYIIKKCYEKD